MSKLLEQLRQTRAEKLAEMEKLIDTKKAENRNLTVEEAKRFDDLEIEIREIDERISELEEEEKREARAAELRRTYGQFQVTREPLVYERRADGPSFFRDLYRARKGDSEARERLDRHMAQVREQRALSTAAGAGGELAPPLWLVDQYVKFARPGRKFADSLNPMTLPSGISSINIPKVTGGSSVAVQASQNTSVSQTDITTGSVSSGIVTIAGKQVASLQLVEQSGIPLDEVIAADLAAAHAQAFDRQVISGDGTSGQLLGVYTHFAANGSVNVAWSPSGTPAVGGPGGLYAAIAQAIGAVNSARFVEPDTIWMHPRRWAWILAASDASNRPLVVPRTLQSYNTVADLQSTGPEGVVGDILGLRVIVDANIPTDLGTGQNQDVILVGVSSDLKLWESELHADVFDQPYADSLGVLFRIYSYAAAIPQRYETSVSVISGTGLVTPTF